MRARNACTSPAALVSPADSACRSSAIVGSIGGRELFLRFRLEVAGVVSLVQLLRGVAGETVDHAPAPHRRPLQEHVSPALHILVLVDGEEFGRAVLVELR